MSNMGSLASTKGLASFHKFIYLGMILLQTMSLVSAYSIEASHEAYDSSFFHELAKNGEIHIDSQSPPTAYSLGLVIRQISPDSSTSTAVVTSTRSVRSVTSGSAIVTAMASPTASSSSSIGSSTSTSSEVPTALPTPFDTSLGNNFTAQACPTFFNTFLNNATFKNCLPVSLLLQNSIGFFKATRSASFLDTVLDASCSASLAICSPLMASIAADLISDSYCGPDYKRQNPIVMQAYTGLLSYEPLYTATCLPNKATGNYCFADAVVNTTNAANLYPYYTALGIPLPKTAQPSCNTCLQQTMSVFAGYAGQKEQPLTKTYVPCAQQINAACGSGFADTSVKVAAESSKSGASRSHATMLSWGLVVTMISWMTLV